MNQYQWTAVGYLTFGVLLLIELLPALSGVSMTSSPLSFQISVILVILGSLCSIALAIMGLIRPEGRFGFGEIADSRWHLYGIWIAVVLIALGLIV